jgi:hypothetical protein
LSEAPSSFAAAPRRFLEREIYLMKNRTIIAAVVAALVCSVLVAAASAGPPRELFRNPFLLPAGRVANVAAGVTYKASDFPLPIRATVPDGSWGGAQWKADSSYQHKKTTVAPFYGWVTFEQHGSKGAITIITPYVGATPSVAAMVAGLRTRGKGATYEPSSPVKLGGYPGVQFDGEVVGKEHVFIPFSPKSTAARWYPDNYGMAQGTVFRIIALNVRGKTIVIYLENLKLPAAEFPAFLTKADTLLKTLKFPSS